MTLISLGLTDSHKRPITDYNEIGVAAGSKEHIRIPNAPFACRWCGRDLAEPHCPHGCGHSWIVDLSAIRNGTKAELDTSGHTWYTVLMNLIR